MRSMIPFLTAALAFAGGADADAGTPAPRHVHTPQDPATVLAVIKSAPQFFNAAINLRGIAERIARGGIHPLWYCKYADGTVVYNKFRFYRGNREVALYFTGRPGSHDCDAWYIDRGQRRRFCTRDALSFAQRHGGIVDIGVAARQ